MSRSNIGPLKCLYKAAQVKSRIVLGLRTAFPPESRTEKDETHPAGTSPSEAVFALS